MQIFIGILLPFLGTALGATCVFFVKKAQKPSLQKSFLGFASGVMAAASVWSLLIPSIEMSASMGKFAFFPACAGFLLGIGFLFLLDRAVPHLPLAQKEGNQKPKKITLTETAMLVFAVTLHNLPEGLSTGAAFAGALSHNSGTTLAGAFALSIGIAIQNFPEGAIISLPLHGEGMKKSRAFLYGTLSGAVEPAAAGITLLLASYIEAVLPYLLAFSAGAMIYVIVEELIPKAGDNTQKSLGTLTFSLGFVLMMILDVALG